MKSNKFFKKWVNRRCRTNKQIFVIGSFYNTKTQYWYGKIKKCLSLVDVKYRFIKIYFKNKIEVTNEDIQKIQENYITNNFFVG